MDTPALRVRVQDADFDPGAEIAALSAGRDDVGAVASFVGLVRADKSDHSAPKAHCSTKPISSSSSKIGNITR